MRKAEVAHQVELCIILGRCITVAYEEGKRGGSETVRAVQTPSQSPDFALYTINTVT